MNGTIARIIADKGFGFIKGDGGKEYFVHRTACKNARLDSLQEGDKVTFEPTEGPKGPRAEDVYV